MRLSIRRAAIAALVACCGAVGLWVAPAHASTIFYVGDTSQPGNVSLGTAITLANLTPGLDIISFRFSNPGRHVLTPAADLPPIVDPVVIDGYTQAGAAPATAGSPATLKIVIDGANMDAGLIVQGNGSTIRGLVVQNVANTGGRCGGAGICILGNRNTVSGNHVGVDYAGAAAAPNAGAGILVDDGDNNVIGGGDPADRNVISGNAGNGVAVNGTGNFVFGNRIGTDANGTSAIANRRDGVLLEGGPAYVGGAAEGEGNLISGNDGDGVEVDATANGSQIAGNWIGTSLDFTIRLPNANGVELHGDNNTVGGTDPRAANTLSGNRLAGLLVDAPGNTNTIEGNLIGAVPGAATTSLGNTGDGILLASDLPNQVGGTALGAGNTIAYNGGNGVTVLLPVSVDNSILGNSIYANGGIAIDLEDNGPTGNDSGDADAGANNRQNYPQVLAGQASTDRVAWLLDTTAGRFRLEFFTGTNCGDATTFVGSDVSTASPTVPQVTTLTVPIAAGDLIYATATQILPGGALASTSELSFCGPVVLP